MPSERSGAIDMAAHGPRLRLWRVGSLAPLVLFYLLLTLLPVLNLAAMSVSDVSWAGGRSHWSFAGTEHLARVFDDEVYRAGVRNTAWFAAVSVSIQMLLGFTLALLVSRTTRGAIEMSASSPASRRGAPNCPPRASRASRTPTPNWPASCACAANASPPF